MTIRLYDLVFDPWLEIAAYQAEMAEMRGKHGATAVFVGTMRDFNQGDTVRDMYLEHYPGMTEKQLQQIIADAERQWMLLHTLVVHRIGAVLPDETLVLVAVWSAHRGDAFDACRFIMESLKSKAPFWKKERLLSGEERWVEKNSSGYQATGEETS